MNLQTHISPELWLAISRSYEAENYCHAILDAMQRMTDMLREKSGASGDGVKLVGQALGGDSPRLRINKLQTQSEHDEQKGLVQVLMGLYQSIRNPRSHEQVTDTKETADAVTHFLDYVLRILGQSEEPFTIAGFLGTVFDPHFVESERYAQLLVEEIPAKKRLDALIAVYRERCASQAGQALQYIGPALYNRLSYDEQTEFIRVASDDLRSTQSDEEIIRTVQILAPGTWPLITEVARLRIENRFVQSIQEGEQYSDGSIIKGALGTWSRDLLSHFSDKDKLRRVFLDKLDDADADDRRYVACFFLSVLPGVFFTEKQRRRCITAISGAVTRGDGYLTQRLVEFLDSCPQEWRADILARLEYWTDPHHPEFCLADGTPFLGKPIDEEEIPF